MSLSMSNGFDNYSFFNDVRNGYSTIHSFDIKETSERQKKICLLLLRNRRKSAYGSLDGNPLSFKHFQGLDSSISVQEIKELVDLEILKKENYSFLIDRTQTTELSEVENILINSCKNDLLIADKLKINKQVKSKKTLIFKLIQPLVACFYEGFLKIIFCQTPD